MTYKFDTIVNRNEAEALKQMIFERAQERSARMVDDVQGDVMDLARSSFVSNNNPFSQIIETANAPQTTTPSVEETAVSAPSQNEPGEDGLGFPVRQLQTRVSAQNRLIGEQVASAALASTMQEARVGLSNKQSFMGALNFLNSQAAVSLIKTRADRFEMVV